MGWFSKEMERKKAENVIKSIRLLKKKELEGLFPEASIYEEKIFCLTKSFIIYKWD